MNENKVRIKRYYSLIAHSPDVVELRHGVWNPVSFTLNDESKTGNLFRLLQRLDGSISPAALARELKVPREDVEALVDYLSQLGVLETGPSNSLDYYLETMAPTLVGAKSPAYHSIRILGDQHLGSLIRDLLKASMRETDIALASEDHPATRTVFDSDTSWLFDGASYYQKVSAFEEWKNTFILLVSNIVNPFYFKILNRASLEHGIPWMHTTMDGPFLFVGPIFVPRRSACYECFEKRITMNLRQGASYQSYKEALINRQVKFGEIPIEPVLRGILSSHTALEILNFMNTQYSFTVGKALSIFLPTMEFSFNEVLRVPGCPACSSLSERDDKELYFDLRTLIKN